MKKITHIKKGNVKTFLATVFTVSAMTISFQALAQLALAAEIGKSEIVATSYSTNITVSNTEAKSESTQNYVKPDYKLVDNDLEYYRDKKPTSLDITREQAAELGVKGLNSVFGLDMNGKVIEMAYNPAQDGLRAYWEGIFWVDGKKSSPEAYVQSYSFCVDAISGELQHVIHDRVLEEKTNTNFDASLQQNTGEYEALAKELVVKLGIIKSNIKSIEYEGQGVSNNDPDIFFNITAENGERAQLMFSRYDKELLAITFDAGMKEMDVAIKNAEDFAKRSEEYFRQNPDASFYEE